MDGLGDQLMKIKSKYLFLFVNNIKIFFKFYWIKNPECYGGILSY